MEKDLLNVISEAIVNQEMKHIAIINEKTEHFGLSINEDQAEYIKKENQKLYDSEMSRLSDD